MKKVKVENRHPTSPLSVNGTIIPKGETGMVPEDCVSKYLVKVNLSAAEKKAAKKAEKELAEKELAEKELAEKELSEAKKGKEK